MLARSVCEATRHSDLKVSPFCTSRLPDVCCWRRPVSERQRREKHWDRHGEKQWEAVKINDNDAAKLRGKRDREGERDCQDSQGTWQRGLGNDSKEGKKVGYSERCIQGDRQQWRMRTSIGDDSERSDDRLKYTEDRQPTGSRTGHGENTHLNFTQAPMSLCYPLRLFYLV